MTRRSLREDGHYEGVPTELILTSRAFPRVFTFLTGYGMGDVEIT
jgi:hypothetical protein